MKQAQRKQQTHSVKCSVIIEHCTLMLHYTHLKDASASLNGWSFPLITQLEKTQQIMYTESIASLYNLLASLVFGVELCLTKPRERGTALDFFFLNINNTFTE